MRFFRVFFWVAASYNIIWGGLLIFSSPEITPFLGFKVPPPLYLVQVLGLFLTVLGIAYAYVAEQPSKSDALVGLGILAHVLFPLFAYLGFLRGELRQGVIWFHLANDLVWLPFFVSYYFWLYNRPGPEKLLNMMGVFGAYFRSNKRK